MENNNTALTGVKMMIADGIVTQEAAEKYFPELKKSDDEKIRNALIRFHKSTIDVDGIKGENIIAWLEKQGEQKSADKVEPKFKKGEFVVDKEGHIFEITRIDKDYNGITYACRLIENPIFWSLYYEDEIRLWDITKDAKDGDVLVTGEVIFIFEKIHDGWIYCHCSRHNDGSFLAESYGLITYKYFGEVHPSTKEQRDLLFQKMREAGYEWDAEKKELKKIEPIDEYEGLTDFERAVADACIGFIDKGLLGWKQYIKDNADDLLKIAVKKFNKVHPKQWKPSEEQMKMLENVRKILHTNKDVYSKANNLMYNFEELIRTLKKLREE